MSDEKDFMFLMSLEDSTEFELADRLLEAVTFDGLALVKMWLRKGISADIRLEHNQQNMLYSVKSVAMVELLKEHSISFEILDDESKTPLFFAPNKDVAKALLDNGVKLDHKDNHGLNALAYVHEIELADFYIEQKIQLDEELTQYLIIMNKSNILAIVEAEMLRRQGEKILNSNEVLLKDTGKTKSRML